MNIEFYLVIISLVFLALSGILSLSALISGKYVYARSGFRAFISSFVLLSLSFAFFMMRFLTGDYSYLYVARHVSDSLPFLYKISAVWAGHSGSLLLLVWIVYFVTIIVMLRYYEYIKYIKNEYIITFVFIIGYFFVMLLFNANPFMQVFPAFREGAGLAKMLQSPAMVLHPPLIYAGYAFVTAIFVFAFSVVVHGHSERLFATSVIYRLTLIAWIFFTAGNIIGMWWAYNEVGWGGYWAWDPVENASLIPWLFTTALLDMSYIMKEKKQWSFHFVLLILLTFLSFLAAVFAARSGMFSSVHSFATGFDPVGYLFYFLMFTIAVLVFFIMRNRMFVKMQYEDILSFESLLFQRSIVIYVLIVGVLMGTYVPVISKFILGINLAFTSQFFASILFPLALIWLILTFLYVRGPWRSSISRKDILTWALVAFLAVVLTGFISGTGVNNVKAILLIFISISLFLSTVAICLQALKKLNKGGKSILRSSLGLFTTVPTILSLYIIFAGIAVFTLGITFSTYDSSKKTVTMVEGAKARISGYTVELKDVRSYERGNNKVVAAHLAISGKSGKVYDIYPKKIVIPNKPHPYTQMAFKRIFLTDVGVMLEGWEALGRPTLSITVKPLVCFIWLGGFIMVIGAVLTIINQKALH